jgi:hypothetical protein
MIAFSVAARKAIEHLAQLDERRVLAVGRGGVCGGAQGFDSQGAEIGGYGLRFAVCDKTAVFSHEPDENIKLLIAPRWGESTLKDLMPYRRDHSLKGRMLTYRLKAFPPRDPERIDVPLSALNSNLAALLFVLMPSAFFVDLFSNWGGGMRLVVADFSCAPIPADAGEEVAELAHRLGTQAYPLKHFSRKEVAILLLEHGVSFALIGSLEVSVADFVCHYRGERVDAEVALLEFRSYQKLLYESAVNEYLKGA